MIKTEVLYSWNFSTEKERGKSWYIIALALIIGVVLWGFIMKWYGLSFVIMMIAGVYFFIENNSSSDIKIQITELGIFINTSFYEYSQIRGYSIIYDFSEPIFLRLYLKKGIKILDLDINTKIVTNIKNIIGNYLEEDTNGKLSVWDKVIRELKL